jgi:hypothetical protein
VLAGASPSSLARVATVRKTGFETRIDMASPATSFAVRALDSKGRVIGRSGAVTAG